jgi:GNAT superfamily N-acetyltransferase
MDIQKEEKSSKAIKLSVSKDGKEVGRMFLYLIHNGLHEEPYGFLEDVYVDEEARGLGIGTKLVLAGIEEAKKQGCYKLLGLSRYSREKVHNWYKKLGFSEHGLQFRMDFK